MARSLLPFVQNGYYASRNWIPLVKGNGFTTSGGGEQEEVWETVSGSIVTFDAVPAPLRQLSVAVEPVQNLNGYDNPWPAGGGKNKFDKTMVTPTSSVGVAQNENGFVLTCLSAGSYKSVTVYIPFTGHDGEDIYLRGDVVNSGSNNGYFSVRFYDDSAEIGGASARLEVYSSRPTHYKTVPTGTTRLACVIYATGSAFASVNDTTTFNNIMLSLTGSAYSPYSNICPISGWTEAKVTRTGKNLVNVNSTENINAYIDSFGRIHANGAWKTCSYIPVEAGKSYCLSGLTSHPNSNTDNYLAYDKNKTLLGVVALNINSYPVTFNASVAFVRFCWKISEEATVMFEQSQTATAYEPYQGNQYTIQLGETVYGGTLDVVNGKMTVDMAMVDLGTLAWNLTSEGLFSTDTLVGNIKPAAWNTEVTESICSVYVANTGSLVYQKRADCAFGLDGNGRMYIYDSTKSAMTAAEFKTAVSGVQLCYPLATPFELTLTPEQISTLQGTNNVWSDAGDVTVEYRVQ